MFIAVLVLVSAYLLACYVYGGMLLVSSLRGKRIRRLIEESRGPVPLTLTDDRESPRAAA